ncbi:MAG: iron-sulfur cluster repair di-iron protein [Acidobacteriota bacterium]|nr:iron-sulfur cluster repair di-iron protein [Acidobacteriota bacterium]
MATSTQTIRDIAAANPASVRVFEKYGIDYCCGGRVPLSEACEAKGLSLNEVLASVQAAERPLSPDDKDWRRESLFALCTHIVVTHHAYVMQESPRLNQLAARVVSRHGATRAELPIIQSKLAELTEELVTHLGKEEVVLFPYIWKLEQHTSENSAPPRGCFGTIEQPINMMTQDHDYAGKLIAEIRALSQDFTPPPGACPTFLAFYSGLHEFEQDLHQHIHLENNILFPRAISLEASHV